MFFVNSVESGDKTRDEHIRGEVLFDSTVKKTEEGYILTLNSTVDVKKDFNMQSYSIMSNSVDIDVSLCF